MPELLVGFISGALVVGAVWFIRSFWGWHVFVQANTKEPAKTERWNDSA